MIEAATGSGSYRIRSRPPTVQQRQQQQPHGAGGRQPQQRDWHDVYIAGFFALSDHEIEAALGQGVMPAINLALRHLANSTLLHDYRLRLRLLHNDTQVIFSGEEAGKWGNAAFWVDEAQSSALANLVVKTN